MERYNRNKKTQTRPQNKAKLQRVRTQNQRRAKGTLARVKMERSCRDYFRWKAKWSKETKTI